MPGHIEVIQTRQYSAHLRHLAHCFGSVPPSHIRSFPIPGITFVCHWSGYIHDLYVTFDAGETLFQLIDYRVGYGLLFVLITRLVLISDRNFLFDDKAKFIRISMTV